MLSLPLIVVSSALALAGFVKGVVGLGLPTISIALMATIMTPAKAAAILVVPSLITNIWQTFGGPYLRQLSIRLWPLMIGICFGTWAAGDLMTGPYARYNTPVLGMLLVVYALLGLGRFKFHVPPRHEKVIGGVVGVLTGIAGAGTGIFAIPAVPFLNSIELQKDELIQALGLFFMLSTVAIGYNLVVADLLNVSLLPLSTAALVAALVGMAIGQFVRSRIPEAAFKRWFFVFLLMLGSYFSSTLLWW